MVKKATVIGTLIIACAIIGGTTLYPASNFESSDSVPDVNDELSRSIIKLDIEKTMRVIVSYHDDKIYERTPFKVDVTDATTLSPIENANVSFMIPEINLRTGKEGYVFFSAPSISRVSAPHIRTEYITSPRDSDCSLPLSVKKAGYRNVTKTIVVHIREDYSSAK